MMPSAPLKPCAAPRCPELVPRGTPRCPTHRTEHYRRQDAARPNKEQRKLYQSARWRKLRRIVLAEEPLCRACRWAASREVDHIVRVQDGGSEDRRNLQGLCRTDHSKKTRNEMSGNELYRPTLGKARCPVIVVCGPPGSGKTTWALHESDWSDHVVDLDEIKRQLSGLETHYAGPEWVEPALRHRNQILSNLAAPLVDRCSTVYLIVSAPKSSERRWWRETLGAKEVVLLEVDSAECERRIRADTSRLESLKQESIDAAQRWWELYSSDYQDRVTAGEALNA